MGFLDKLQQSAKDTLDKGKGKLDELQADREADRLLRELGAWYYAGRTGRDEGKAAAEIERVVGELQAHEAEHGALGSAATTDEASPRAPEPAAPEPAAAEPAAPDVVPPVTSGPPSAPVTSGPPPPPA